MRLLILLTFLFTSSVFAQEEGSEEKEEITGSAAFNYFSESNRTCTFKITNPSDSYGKVSFDIIQNNNDNEIIKAQPFTYNLKGGQTVEREIKTKKDAVNCRLEIKKSDIRKPQKSAEDIEKALEQKKATLEKLEEEIEALEGQLGN